MRKPFKTLEHAHYESPIGSKVREVREEARAPVLKLYLSIFMALIFDSNVDGGMPSLAAAPNGPDTLPPASARAESIIFRPSPADLLNDWRAGLR